MTITASAIITDRPQADGMRKIREEHIDSLGVKHYRQFTAAADYDEAAGLAIAASEIAASLISREQASYITAIESGTNPFRSSENVEVTPNFNTRAAMLSIVLGYFLSLEDPVGLAPAVPYLDNLTDQSLMALLSLTQAEVDVLRARALEVVAIQADIDSYVPVLNGEG